MIRAANIKISKTFFDNREESEEIAPGALKELTQEVNLLNTGIGPIHDYEEVRIAPGREADAPTG